MSENTSLTREVQMAYYRNVSAESDQDQYDVIFQEFDFACMDSECDYFCPECRNMLNCAVYDDVKQGWDSFYS
jgi:hypothetical protein